MRVRVRASCIVCVRRVSCVHTHTSTLLQLQNKAGKPAARVLEETQSTQPDIRCLRAGRQHEKQGLHSRLLDAEARAACAKCDLSAAEAKIKKLHAAAAVAASRAESKMKLLQVEREEMCQLSRMRL